MSTSTIQFSDRLLAEAVRAAERDGSAVAVDDAAADAARAAGGDLEQRIVTRARALPDGASLDAALGQVRRATLLIAFAATVLAALAGVGAARAVLGGDGDARVNVFLVLGGLLVVQTLALLGWLLLVGAGPATLAGSSLGGAVAAIGRRLALRLHRGPEQLAAMQATAGVLATSSVGRWSFSAVSHLLWTGFNVGAIVVIVVLLSARQYTFVWETTILSEDTYVPLTRAIAAVPEAVGFAGPDEEQIRASRWSGDPGDIRVPTEAPSDRAGAWSQLLLGSIVMYGFAPRLLLLGLCLSLRRSAQTRYRLDLDRPGFAALREMLLPARRALGVIDEDDGPTKDVAGQRVAPTQRPTGPPAILAVDTMTDGTWPPAINGIAWEDFGTIDDGAAQRALLDRLRGAGTEPTCLVVVCDLTLTPDRGVQRFLGDLRSAVGRPIAIVLTAGDRLRQRVDADATASRAADWRRIAAEAGVDAARVLEIDLDHATVESLSSLRTLVAGESDGATERRSGEGGVDPALATIETHARQWDGAPSTKEQAALHEAIARCFGAGERSWIARWGITGTDASALTDMSQLRDGASRLVASLPDRLRSSPKWLAAGAVTGALGCVAAAALISPVAIGSLPLWTGMGAGLGALLQQVGGTEAAVDDTGDDVDFDTAVRAAALFAVLLHLQTYDEATIGRVLDATFGGDAQSIDAEALTPWLAEVRHRLDLALTREGGAA